MWAGSADEQGVYALVSALGALFVRIVLQPFEVRYTLSVPENFGMYTDLTLKHD